MQFPCVKPTGRSYYCAKEEFHANFYSFINSLIRAETKALIGGGVYESHYFIFNNGDENYGAS